ncbi:hypothetical protein HDU76_011532, partial [Blyttiomyces sp. JEL0837]
ITFPRVPGHEIVGRVVKAGENVPPRFKSPNLRVGVGWTSGHCFNCDACRQGSFNLCSDHSANGITGITRDGGYAEYLVARYEALAIVPENVDAAELAPM